MELLNWNFQLQIHVNLFVHVHLIEIGKVLDVQHLDEELDLDLELDRLDLDGNDLYSLEDLKVLDLVVDMGTLKVVDLVVPHPSLQIYLATVARFVGLCSFFQHSIKKTAE